MCPLYYNNEGMEATVTTEEVRTDRRVSSLASVLAPGRLIWLVVLVGGLLRLYRYDALSLWVDEGLSILFQRLPWDTVLGFHGAYDTHPPIYYALAKAATWVAPELMAGRLVSVVVGTLTLPVVYGLGSRLLGKWGGLVATIVVALSPLHIWYSQEARPYALAMLAVCLCYLALVAFYQTLDWRWAAFYGFIVTLSLYSDLSVIYALAPQIVLLIYMVAVKGKQAWWLWLAGAVGVIGFLPWVPQVISVAQSLDGRLDSYLGVTLDRVSYSLLSVMGVGGEASYFWGSEPTAWERWANWQPAMLVVVLVVWIAGIIALWKRGVLSLLCVLCLFVGTVIVGILMSLISAGYGERTIIYALVGWALIFGAVTTTPITKVWRWAGIGASVVVMYLSLASLWAIYRGGDKQHWRELAGDARTVAQAGETVVMYPEVTGLLLDLYHPGAFDMSLNIIDYGDLPTKVNGTKSLWLAYIETGGFERIQAQLEAHGYEQVEHKYYWNPMWLDHYELK